MQRTQRTRWILVVSLLMTLGLSWNLSADEPPAVADPPALEEIGGSPVPAEPFLLPDEETGDGEIFLGPCTATLDCGDGNVISCSGNNKCEANNGGGYVECDGQRTTCPNRCQVTLFCKCKCRSTSVTCSSNSGDCQNNGDSITCNGFTITCSRICIFDGCPILP